MVVRQRLMIFAFFMFFFFFNDTATTEIYTLSLHDALPICPSISTSFGSLIVVLRENSFRIAFEIPSAAQAVSCGELVRSILGRKRMENQSPFPAVDSQRLPRCPRPAV